MMAQRGKTTIELVPPVKPHNMSPSHLIFAALLRLTTATETRGCQNQDYMDRMSAQDASDCVRACGSVKSTQLQLSDLIEADNIQMECAKAWRTLRRVKPCLKACPESFAKRGALQALNNGGYHIYCQQLRQDVEDNRECVRTVLESSSRRCSGAFCMNEGLKKARNAKDRKLNVALQMCSHRLCHFECLEALFQEPASNCTSTAPLLMLSKITDHIRSFLNTSKSMGAACGSPPMRVPSECTTLLRMEEQYRLVRNTASPLVLSLVALSVIALRAL